MKILFINNMLIHYLILKKLQTNFKLRRLWFILFIDPAIVTRRYWAPNLAEDINWAQLHLHKVRPERELIENDSQFQMVVYKAKEKLFYRVEQAQSTLLFVYVVLSQEVFLSMTGHLSWCSCHHKVPGDSSPVTLTEYLKTC